MTPPKDRNSMGFVAYVSLALALSAQGGAAIWWAGIINTRVAMIERQARTSRRIDDNGDLLVQRIGGEKAAPVDLARALKEPSWFDPKSGGRRL